MIEFKFRIKREGIRHRYRASRSLYRMLYQPEFDEDYFVNDIMEHHINEVPNNTHVRNRLWSIRFLTNISRDDIRWTSLLQYFQIRFYSTDDIDEYEPLSEDNHISEVVTSRPRNVRRVTLPNDMNVGDVIGIQNVAFNQQPRELLIQQPSHADINYRLGNINETMGVIGTGLDTSGSISFEAVHGDITYDSLNNRFNITSTTRSRNRTTQEPLSLEKIVNDLKTYFPFILSDDIPEVLQALTVFYNTVCKKIKERTQS